MSAFIYLTTAQKQFMKMINAVTCCGQLVIERNYCKFVQYKFWL